MHRERTNIHRESVNTHLERVNIDSEPPNSDPESANIDESRVNTKNYRLLGGFQWMVNRICRIRRINPYSPIPPYYTPLYLLSSNQEQRAKRYPD